MKKLVLVLALVGISISTSFGSVGDSIVKPQGVSLTQEEKDSIVSGVFKVINDNYPGIQEFTGFNRSIDGYVDQKVTGKKSEVNSDIPDMYISITFDGTPSINTIKELVQMKIDRLKESGYPIVPDRYLVKFVEKEGKIFLVVALDETYIYGGKS
jgi:hypothetical protein